ncbi:hypothetical protein D9C73_027521 [Collichthys lucidus]|uniref:Uncharacterized protein n=1 Tax=Collichthys lucidus TaxID=240159 RepID=A0A4U5VUR2_COLLU|nr:hypothetical protein D9C73_027521 [Collichthys lucidus]
MFEHHNLYGSRWWIDDKKETWLKIMLVTAPLLIVCGIALIAHRIYSRRPSGRVSNRYSDPRSHFYNDIYGPTTYPFDDATWENTLVTDKLIALEDVTGHDVPNQREENKEEEGGGENPLLLTSESPSVI